VDPFVNLTPALAVCRAGYKLGSRQQLQRMLVRSLVRPKRNGALKGAPRKITFFYYLSSEYQIAQGKCVNFWKIIFT
jgi:hypothetical protein